MPGTAAKKYEEGIFMKKIVKGILLLAAAAAVVTGCSRICLLYTSDAADEEDV